MKILAVSDLHFGLTQFDWVAQQAGNYDLVIIAGDLLDVGGHLDLDAQITVVVKYLRTISAQPACWSAQAITTATRKTKKNETQEYVARWLQRVRSAGPRGRWRQHRSGRPSCFGLPVVGRADHPEAMQRFLLAARPAAGENVAVGASRPARRRGRQLDRQGACGRHLPREHHPRTQSRFRFLRSHPQLAVPHRRSMGLAPRTNLDFQRRHATRRAPAYIELDLARRTARWVSQAGDEEISLDQPVGIPPAIIGSRRAVYFKL
ncbi:MAG: metallophosphoesterase [Lacunisphaera sp.]